MLSDLLKLVMSTLREKDDAHIVRTGVRRFFVINGYEEVASFLGRWVRSGGYYDMRSFDFATMYTTLPHEDLVFRLTKVVREAFDFMSVDLGNEFVLSGFVVA